MDAAHFSLPFMMEKLLKVSVKAVVSTCQVLEEAPPHPGYRIHLQPCPLFREVPFLC